MPLKAEGIAILVGLTVTCFLLFLLGIYCHFCAETESGGHYYKSNENLAKVIFVKNGSAGPAKNKGGRCKCSNKFKGSCKKCEGEDFVDDGSDGEHPDFSDFGGDKGLDPNWGNKPDPIRSALGGSGFGGGGNNSGGGGGSGGGDNSGGGDSSHYGVMMRDD